MVSFAFGLIPLVALDGHRLPRPDLAHGCCSSRWWRRSSWCSRWAIAIGAAAINVFYRDVGNIARHALRFWFYLSPSLYSIDDVQKIAASNPLIELWYRLNPFTYILGGYRDVIYYGQAPDWTGLAAVTLGSRRPARARDPGVQARRAAVREGAVSAPAVAGNEIAIKAEDLGVKYNLRLGKKPTLRQTIVRRAKGRPEGDFWALRHASFQVRQGESLGVIGPNGAGKSTLLQVLAGIILPSEGMVEVDGHISSLLTLGVGFDAELSGTDNIRLAGAFMGLDHRVVEERLPGIVEYAELGDFIDVPIKTYSSGMRARLGFAIATAVEPDILLLDEVLSTGDASFREKSKQRVGELVRGGEGHRPRHPRHELGDRPLQPGDADREGRDRPRGRARRGGRASTRSGPPSGAPSSWPRACSRPRRCPRRRSAPRR